MLFLSSFVLAQFIFIFGFFRSDSVRIFFASVCISAASLQPDAIFHSELTNSTFMLTLNLAFWHLSCILPCYFYSINFALIYLTFWCIILPIYLPFSVILFLLEFCSNSMHLNFAFLNKIHNVFLRNSSRSSLRKFCASKIRRHASSIKSRII